MKKIVVRNSFFRAPVICLLRDKKPCLPEQQFSILGITGEEELPVYRQFMSFSEPLDKLVYSE